MWNPIHKQGRDSAASSLLPEDYLERKVELRTNVIYLSLFAVVIVGVVGAFFVTNRQWLEVKEHQETINVRYAQAAKDIEQLKILEGQKEQMLGKAELTTALLEKAPRSVLLAELVNRMPERLTLLQFELVSKRVETAKGSRAAAASSAAPAQPARGGRRSLVGESAASPAQASAEPSPKAPKLDTTLTIIGVAAAHTQVAEYIASLQECKLLEKVELKFSENTIINDRGMNKFRLEVKLRNDADARQLESVVADGREAFGSLDGSTLTITPGQQQKPPAAASAGDGGKGN